jgi:signal peptidase I
MFPFIKEADIVSIRPVSIAEVRIGDVIIYKNSRQLVAHRLIKKTVISDGCLLTTKGDYVSHPDRALESHRLLGMVVGIRRGKRQFALDTMSRRLEGKCIGIFSAWLGLHHFVSAAKFANDVKRTMVSRLAKGCLHIRRTPNGRQE